MGTPTTISRYRLSTLLRDVDGRSYLTEAARYGYRELQDNIGHVVKDGDDLWTIAGRYYQNILGGETLFWVIGHFQPVPIHDPTIALTPGSVVIVPSERTVREEILSERRRAAGLR